MSGDNGRMAEAPKARDINAQIRYTMWSVFRVDRTQVATNLTAATSELVEQTAAALDRGAPVADHATLEAGVGHQEVGAAAEHEQGRARLVERAHGVDELGLGGDVVDAPGDGAADAQGGEVGQAGGVAGCSHVPQANGARRPGVSAPGAPSPGTWPAPSPRRGR